MLLVEPMGSPAFARWTLAAVVLTALLAASRSRAAEAETPSPEALVETDLGSFVIRLLPDVAPEHVRSFVDTVRAGGYDGTVFHRAVPGQVIQGGDPFSKDPSREADYGRGGFGLLRAEPSRRSFTRGVVAAARCPTSPDSAGSQFFVVLADQPALQGHYTLFGEVVSGMDVVDAIGDAGGDDGKPRRRIEMRVRLRD
jgi:peptidyl-prolyl cis-trans isomerase B (cyclophilin B)